MKKRLLSLLVCLGMLLCILLAAAGAQGTAQTYLALGDSITTGEGLGDDQPSFAQLVAENHSYILDDTLAKNGATTLDVLNILAEPANAAKLATADVITLTVGGNDLMGALYSYLAAQYNAQPGIEAEISPEEMQDKLMNADFMTLAFALSVLPDFAQSEEAAGALQTFTAQLGQIIAAVKGANPDVTLIVANQYNPYAHVGAGLTGQQAVWADTLSTSFDAGVTALNTAIQLVGVQTGCIVADAYSAFAAAGENPCNATFIVSPINLDFHPNAYGHTLLAEAVEAVLPVQAPEQTEGVNVGGLALISDGTPVYAATNSLGMVTAATEQDSWNIKYDGQTLTLKDATILGAGWGVRSYGSLTLELSGSSKIGVSGGGDSVYGIYVDGDLTIQGSGSLSTAASDAGEEGVSDGIYASGSITISDGTLNAVGGTANYSSGIYAGGSISLAGPAAKVTAQGGAGVEGSAGIYAGGNAVISDGCLNTAGGTVTGEAGISDGIYATGDLTISGGTIYATGDTANYSSGIYAGGGLTVEAPAQVTAQGGAGVEGSAGILAENGAITISGGTVTAASGSSSGEESVTSGLYTKHGDLTISGGTVIATGKGGACQTIGIYCGFNLAITGGTITVTTVEVPESAQANFGIYCYEQIDITGTPTINTSSDGVDQVGIYAFFGDILLHGEKQIPDACALSIVEGKAVSGIRQVQVLAVNGVDILTAENHTVACGGGTAVYDPETGVLTLTDAAIDTPFHALDYMQPLCVGIYSDAEIPITLVLNGQNTISGDMTTGIFLQGDLTIQGDGTLSVSGQRDSRLGIYALGSLVQNSGEVTLDVTTYGIYTDSSFDLTGGSLNINSETNTYNYSCLHINNGFRMSGGTITLQRSGTTSGIYVDAGGLEISGGILRDYCSAADSLSIGVMHGSCSITGGVVECTGPFSVYNVDMYDTALSITGGDLTIAAYDIGLNIFYGTLSIGGDADITITASRQGGQACYAPEIEISGVSGYSSNQSTLEIKDGQVVSGLHLRTVFVNGVDLLLAENHTIACGGGTAVYDPEAGVLTLKDAEITSGYAFNNFQFRTVSAGIFSDRDLILVLEGTSSISGDLFYGVFSLGTLTVQGDGALNVTADGYGIASQYDLTIAGGTLALRADGGLTNDPDDTFNREYFSALASTRGNVKITGGVIEASASGTEYMGIFSYYNLTITGGTVNVTLTAADSESDNYKSAINSWDGTISIQGGAVNVTAQGQFLSGLRSGGVNVTGGTVNITAEGENSFGIRLWSNRTITVSGADTVLTVSGSSTGIYGNLNVNSGTVSAASTDGVALLLYTGGLEVKAGAKLTLSAPAAVYLADSSHDVAAEEVLRLPGSGLPDGYELSKLTASNADGESVYVYTIGKEGETPSYDAASGILSGAATELTIYAAGGSSGGSSGGSGNKTEISTKPDGTTTTTVTKPDGTTTTTESKPDGTTTTTEAKPDGTVTETTDCPDGSSSATITAGTSGTSASQVTLSQERLDKAQSATISLPMSSVTAAAEQDTAPTVTVKLPSSQDAQVEIPVANMTAGTVAVLVAEDGSETVVQTSVPTSEGVVLTVHDGDTFKIVDNSKDFTDVEATHWGSDAVAFVSSRELFSGTSETAFSPELTMSRGMSVTLLARFDGVDTSGGDTWYAAGRQWAMGEGISDGTNMDAELTREQLATMLYRYAQYKGYDVSTEDADALQSFPDGGETSDFAVSALQWACGAGIISGKGDGALAPADSVTRVETAAMFMRFCQWAAS